MNERPLDGVRVIEVGQLVAGPFAGAMLAYFGADVVKVEPLGGDPLRGWRGLEGGTSLWWRSVARNKRCVAMDLHREEGRALLRRLATRSDVLLENFRPGTMEAWGLGPQELGKVAPGLVYARVSGFGQTGPDRERPGFASVCEAAAGLRHLNGVPGEVPVRTNLSLGDSLGGLHAMIGVLLALRVKERTGRGQVVDVALTESILNMLESTLMEADRLGEVRGPSGRTITGVVPSNAYVCADGRFVVVGANTDKLFLRLMAIIGRDDLARDPSLSRNPGRVARAGEIDAAIEGWTASLSAEDVVLALDSVGIPSSSIRDAAQVLKDPQLAARGYMEELTSRGDGLRLPAFAPRLEGTPGRSDWAGPEVGAHTDEVLVELGLAPEQIVTLRSAAVIA